MRLSRKLRLLLAAVWVLFVLYPNPVMLVRSIDHVLHPDVDAQAAAPLAATMPDDPRQIERRVLGDAVPYEYDWRVDGVPWYFPTTREALARGRGDCESRALVLASVLAAKGIPYELKMSFDHIWVEYPGKQPNAIENDGVAIADRRGLHWPKDIDPVQELRDQASFYWTPMPLERKALLLLGLAVIVAFNALARGVAALRRRLVPSAPTAASQPREGHR